MDPLNPTNAAILQTMNEAENLLTSTSRDLLAVVDRPKLDAVERQHLRKTIDQISLMSLEARIRLQNEWNGSQEQENIFRENSKQLISTLREVSTSLGNKESIVRILNRVNSICPLWPFC